MTTEVKLSDPTYLKPEILQVVRALNGTLSEILTNPRIYHNGPLMREIIFPSDDLQGQFMDYMESFHPHIGMLWDIHGKSIFLEDVPVQEA